MNIPLIIIGILVAVSVPAFINESSRANIALRKFLRLVGIIITLIGVSCTFF